MKDSLWSVDLFRCESVTPKSHWVLLVMGQFIRRIIGFGVHAGVVDGLTLCCMFNRILVEANPPRYLSSDHDPLFEYHRWQANLRFLGVHEIKTVPYMPPSHPFIERLIGTVRREFPDHALFWNSLDLQGKLETFRIYYIENRVHTLLDGDTPAEISGESTMKRAKLACFNWEPHCHGLVQLPLAA